MFNYNTTGKFLGSLSIAQSNLTSENQSYFWQYLERQSKQTILANLKVDSFGTKMYQDSWVEGHLLRRYI
jgi:hypothetical protein